MGKFPDRAECEQAQDRGWRGLEKLSLAYSSRIKATLLIAALFSANDKRKMEYNQTLA